MFEKHQLLVSNHKSWPIRMGYICASLPLHLLHLFRDLTLIFCNLSFALGLSLCKFVLPVFFADIVLSIDAHSSGAKSGVRRSRILFESLVIVDVLVLGGFNEIKI